MSLNTASANSRPDAQTPGAMLANCQNRVEIGQTQNALAFTHQSGFLFSMLDRQEKVEPDANVLARSQAEWKRNTECRPLRLVDCLHLPTIDLYP